MEGIVTLIRRLLPEEKQRMKHKKSKRMDWVQLCPFCETWVGSLVEHVKSAHSDKNSRQIRTQCPYEDCGKMVVDIKNHMRMVHQKIRNFSCEECHATFPSNYQTIKHVESVHDNTKVKCEECDGLFKTNTLNGHVRRVHRGIKPSIPCTEGNCEKAFGSAADLERHVLGVHMKWKAPCPECGKKIRMETLVKHIKTAHKGMHKFKCQQCGQGFHNQKGLDHHVRVKHQGTFLHCKATLESGAECGKIIYSEEGLINHIQCKHMDGHAVCPQCSTAVFPCYLPHHITTVHNNQGSAECVVKGCGVWLSDYSEQRQHIDTVHQALGLEWCHVCSQVVLQLLEHNKIHHEAELPFQPVYGVCVGIQCTWQDCAFMANGETHLARHVKERHQKIEAVKCEECGKKVRNMEEHLNVIHDRVKSIPCDLCEKFFSTEKKKNTHRRVHSKMKETCKQCGTTVTNLRQHERFVHEKDLPFHCKEIGCETKFTSNCSLKKHFNSVHQMMREKCPICQKLVGSLKKHTQIVHDKIREYQCPECQKFFQTRTHVKNHYNRVHMGLKEQCPDCNKMVQDVRTHVNFVHKKVANFPCDQCNTKCVSSTALKKHTLSVHMKDYTECPTCGISVPSAHIGQHIQRNHRNVALDNFSCRECERTFPSSSELTMHIMMIHLELKEHCSICGQMTSNLKNHSLYGNCVGGN